MEQEQKPRGQALITFLRELVPDWRPTREQVLWAIRASIALVVLLAFLVLIGAWLWNVVHNYVHPKTPSDRKDLVNIFVVIGAGVVGLLTATAAIGNFYISRRNLQQQRILEEERTQDDSLQAYYKQLGDLLTEHDLKKKKPADDVALLARAQTIVVVRRLDGSRKSDLVLFLYGAGLISKGGAIGDLFGADLGGADLRGADLSGAGLSATNLRGSDLSEADLDSANLSEANLDSADLSGTMGITNERLVEQHAWSLEDAAMPNGQKYEDWIKDKEGRKEDGGNG